MKNSNKKDQSDFEKSWEEAFKGAEIEPSEDVWLKIESTLTKQESKGYKRTIIFYKYAAAVSLLLLISTAVISFYLFNQQGNSSSRDLTNNTPLQQDTRQEAATSKVPEDNEPNIALQNNNGIDEKNGIIDEKTDGPSRNSIAENIKTDENKYIAIDEKPVLKIDGTTNIPRGNQEISKEKYPSPEGSNYYSKSNESDKSIIPSDYVDDRTDLPNRNGLTSLQLLSPKEFGPLAIETVPLQTEIYKVVVNNGKDKKSEKTSSSKDFFAGVQFTPGYFDPNIQMNSNNSAMSANPAAFSMMGVNPTNQEQDIQPQMSYTYGMNFGLKVAKRWLVHMGVQYAKNNTVGTTQQYFSDEKNSLYLAIPSTLNNLENRAAERQFVSLDMATPLSMNQSIDLNNNYEFASIPVKAGFIVIDKKISLILSTGVATDFFIKNEVQDQMKNFEKDVIRPGDSSPFRDVYFNALASSEIIFHFTKNYSISIEPSFRTALNSFSKPESLFSSRPQTFGISAGFRYNF